ncbi:membrane associated rhomboid family serine protease [Palleronia aestuarii]|uniref:Membrane associated rhomboid family serine protease n=1 Tax=Palleronia aestuarii TaxID=568105 RepID=A0A2W7N774_9RHOB|nr:rhomboid family intramembrane serine protease [Palleronia aestuarii]PZX15971.1 membrane associated rhomboid family serine protease [Palleronia aestuarii]
MFPIRDHNPSQSVPWVTYALIAANVAVFFATAPAFADPRALAALLERWALVPAISSPVTFLSSQFLHGGLMHLLGNMWFLWLFGDNIEEEMGPLPFLLFYLAAGVAAAIGQTLPDPGSTVPMVGASGAIAGVMGGYLLLFPRARVDILVILLIFFRIIPVPAWIVLGIWFALQILSGANTPAGAGGVAYWAHAGGFVAGIALTLPLFLRRGGPRYWRRTSGHPPHAPARYATRASTIPKVGRKR